MVKMDVGVVIVRLFLNEPESRLNMMQHGLLTIQQAV
jgi:hypothetical protein